MWLLLCEHTDFSALWAYRGLRERGVPIELVSAGALVNALGWEHRLGIGGASIRIDLADGRTIDGDAVRGVVNRLVSLPTERHALAATPDRDYAMQELNALFLSWLTAVRGPVLGRPTPQGLSGPWLHRSEWLALGAQAGLNVDVYCRSSREAPETLTDEAALVGARTLVVIAGRPAGRVPAHVAAGSARLARLADADFLGVQFGTPRRKPWTFVGATPFPDLSLGGLSALDLLEAALGDGA